MSSNGMSSSSSGVSHGTDPAPAPSTTTAQSLLEALEYDRMRDAWAREQKHFDATAAQLGVDDAQIRVQACPLVVSGRVNGQFFYLRERHDAWRVTVAAASNPDVDVWTNYSNPAEDIAEGSAFDIYEQDEPAPSAALRLAVAALSRFNGGRDHHDPLCPFLQQRADHRGSVYLANACQCDLISQVEARVRRQAPPQFEHH